MRQTSEPEVYRSTVRDQLQRVLSHSLFHRSERMCRFLKLVVEYFLDGRGGELKEYLIGLEVFDRGQCYDPRIDPIVRVEARRLRSKLKTYYESDGRADSVWIALAPGGYVPEIRLRNLPQLAAAESGVHTIAVVPFAYLGCCRKNDYFSEGLTDELVHELIRVPGFRVVAARFFAQAAERQGDMPATALTGSVRMGRTILRVCAQWIDTESGVYLWSDAFVRPSRNLLALQAEIARAIAHSLRLRSGQAGPFSRHPVRLNATI